MGIHSLIQVRCGDNEGNAYAHSTSWTKKKRWHHKFQFEENDYKIKVDCEEWCYSLFAFAATDYIKWGVWVECVRCGRILNVNHQAFKNDRGVFRQVYKCACRGGGGEGGGKNIQVPAPETQRIIDNDPDKVTILINDSARNNFEEDILPVLEQGSNLLIFALEMTKVVMA